MIFPKQLPLKAQSFAELRKNGCVYIDKTEYMANFLERGAESTFLSRPRLFGKTLMLSAFEEFLSIDRNSSSLFKGLFIDGKEELKSSWQNNYPVIRVSFKGVSAGKADGFFKKLRQALSETFCRFESVFDWKQADLPIQRKGYREYMRATGGSLSRSLLLLSQMLFRHYGKQAILLIDDADAPLVAAESHGCYQPVLNKIKQLISLAAVENPCVKFALVMARLPVADLVFDADFSSFQIEDVSMCFDDNSFGFTAKEVRELLEQNGLGAQVESFEKNYQGYFLGEEGGCYAPFDVLKQIYELAKNPDASPKAHWFEKEDESIISACLKNADESPELQVLLKNEPLPFDKCSGMNVRCSSPSGSIEICSRLIHQGYLSFLSIEEGAKRGIEYPDVLEYVCPANRQVLLSLRAMTRKRLAQTLAASIRSQEIKGKIASGDMTPIQSIYPLLRWKLADYAIEDGPAACGEFLSAFFQEGGKGQQKKQANQSKDMATRNKEENYGEAVVCLMPKPSKLFVFASSWKESSSEEELLKDAKASLEEAVASTKEGGNGDKACGADFATCFGLSFYKNRCIALAQQNVALPEAIVHEEQVQPPAPGQRRTKQQTRAIRDEILAHAQKIAAAIELQASKEAKTNSQMDTSPNTEAELGWDSKLVEGIHMGDLAPEAIRLFRKDSRLSRRADKEMAALPDSELFQRLGLVSKDDTCTRAAVLLFHPAPTEFFPGAFISMLASRNSKILYQERLKGPLILQANRFMRAICNKCLKEYIIYDKEHGAHRYAFPLLAVREAVMNALCHCNWQAGLPVTVDLEDNKLFISNAVEFSDRSNIGNIFRPTHYTSVLNESIANVLFLSGYIHLAASGIDAIHASSRELQANTPEYSLIKNMLTLQLGFDPSSLQLLAKARAETVLPIEEAVLGMLKQKPKMPKGAIAERLGMPIDFAEFAINRLANAGKLKLRGSYAHPFWQLPQ